MKQHITEEQWNELSDNEKDKLLPPHPYRHSSNLCAFEVMNYKDMFRPNIGQMIEFLGDDWFVEAPEGAGEAPNFDDPQPVENNRLCDALWEAVKNKLYDK